MTIEQSVRLRQNTVAGVVGNVFEWYDFAVFGFLAPMLGGLFFPSEDPLSGLLKTYGVFAAGYLMRPLGGILFGHLGDRLGRKLPLRDVLRAMPWRVVRLVAIIVIAGTSAYILLAALSVISFIALWTLKLLSAGEVGC